MVLVCAFSLYASETTNSQTTNQMDTNGIYAEVSFFPNIEHDQRLTVDIFIVNTNTYGFWGRKVDENTDNTATVLQQMFSDTFLYFTPTNPFYDAIQLQDTTGKKIPLLKPYVFSPSSYPAFFSLSAARKSNQYPSASEPRSLKSSHDTLAQFQLEDYFDIREPGDYQLTVWPKIYKRASTNDDICRRIDLPPVTVTIKWNGATKK